MTLKFDLLKELPGGSDLVTWFGGRVPSFHDAEVIGLTLDRQRSRCCIKIHAFEMTSQTDPEGYFVCVKHAVITFELENVTELALDGFNHQNAINGLDITRTSDGRFRLELDPSYGLAGSIEALAVQISVEPGIPPDSIYLARGASSGRPKEGG